MSDPTPSPDESFKVLTKHTGRVLRACGFTGSGQNYRRERGDQWQAINIQKSQWRITSEEPIIFYVNIGIEFPTLQFERCLPLPDSLSKFSAAKAHTSFRIDELLPDARGDWFHVGGLEEWNEEEFCDRFGRLLADQLVPLLDEMSTPRGLARVLRMMPWRVQPGLCAFIGKELVPPVWDQADCDAGEWEQDKEGLWWKRGER
jgi:hypothetical protein